jgi:hypothetical protein
MTDPCTEFWFFTFLPLFKWKFRSLYTAIILIYGSIEFPHYYTCFMQLRHADCATFLQPFEPRPLQGSGYLACLIALNKRIHTKCWTHNMGMKSTVFWVVEPDVSEDHIAPTCRTRNKQKTTRSGEQAALALISTMKIEATCSSKISGLLRITRRCKPKTVGDSSHLRELQLATYTQS